MDDNQSPRTIRFGRQCESCGYYGVLPGSACPHCGAKNTTKRRNNTWIVLGIILAILVGLVVLFKIAQYFGF